MILRSCTRQRNALLNATSAFARTSSPWSRTYVRRKHLVPSLGEHDATFKNHGISDLYSPAAFQVAWTDYQGHVVNQINNHVEGTTFKDWDAKSLSIAIARDPSMASLFNFASMAHNNHFYFKCLSYRPTEPSLLLKQHLESSFSSFDSLRETFIETARAMFGPGFVWLVQFHEPPSNVSHASNRTNRHQFRILNTYLAGSPYPGAHNRQQPVDMNAVNLRTTPDEYYRMGTPQHGAGVFGSNALSRGSYRTPQDSSDTRSLSGANCTPVLCVNTWEHAWITDWGVSGKRAFLERWWQRIDWDAVEGNCLNLKDTRVSSR